MTHFGQLAKSIGDFVVKPCRRAGNSAGFPDVVSVSNQRHASDRHTRDELDEMP
jgi:hypothetical protein